MFPHEIWKEIFFFIQPRILFPWRRVSKDMGKIIEQLVMDQRYQTIYQLFHSSSFQELFSSLALKHHISNNRHWKLVTYETYPPEWSDFSITSIRLQLA